MSYSWAERVSFACRTQYEQGPLKAWANLLLNQIL